MQCTSVFMYTHVSWINCIQVFIIMDGLKRFKTNLQIAPLSDSKCYEYARYGCHTKRKEHTQLMFVRRSPGLICRKGGGWWLCGSFELSLLSYSQVRVVWHWIGVWRSMASKVVYFTINGRPEQAEFTNNSPAQDVKGKSQLFHKFFFLPSKSTLCWLKSTFVLLSIVLLSVYFIPKSIMYNNILILSIPICIINVKDVETTLSFFFLWESNTRHRWCGQLLSWRGQDTNICSQ